MRRRGPIGRIRGANGAHRSRSRRGRAQDLGGHRPGRSGRRPGPLLVAAAGPPRFAGIRDRSRQWLLDGEGIGRRIGRERHAGDAGGQSRLRSLGPDRRLRGLECRDHGALVDESDRRARSRGASRRSRDGRSGRHVRCGVRRTGNRSRRHHPRPGPLRSSHTDAGHPGRRAPVGGRRLSANRRSEPTDRDGSNGRRTGGGGWLRQRCGAGRR